MITMTLLALAAFWIVALRRYPSLFVPRKPARLAIGPDRDVPGENWIEVMPTPSHREASSLQEVA